MNIIKRFFDHELPTKMGGVSASCARRRTFYAHPCGIIDCDPALLR